MALKHNPKKTAASEKGKRLCTLLCEGDCQATLMKLCGKNCKKKCTTTFAGTAKGLVLWRTAYYTLPKQCRVKHLVMMFHAAMQPMGDSISSLGIRDAGFLMCYHFMGVPCCRKAFGLLTGPFCE